MRLITCVLLLFYVVSCGTSGSAPAPSSGSSLDSIRSLTLGGVDESSITLSWDLLKTEEGAVDPTIGYTVYAETPDEEGVFTKIPDTETIYTLFFAIDLGEGRRSTLLPVDGTGNRARIKVGNLNNNTPYRIVVVANDASGNSSRSELLVYTTSALTDPDITGLVVSTTLDSDRVTVTWDPKEGAHAYAIQATDGANQFGSDVSTDNVITVICSPDFPLLCKRSDQFAQEEESKLEYTFQVNQRGSRYKLAIISFNFQDLVGLQAVDEAGLKKTLIEAMLAQVEDESSTVGGRLKNAIGDPNRVQDFQVQVSVAEAATDLVLDSTGSTVSASWGHGVGAEYYHAILTGEGVVVTNTIDRNDPSGRFTGGGYVGFGGLSPNTAYTVTIQSFTMSDRVINLGGEVSDVLFTKDALDALSPPEKIAGENLILISGERELGIFWDTVEANSVIGYNVFYWVGDAPHQPQYVAGRGETDLTFTVPPGDYQVRIDVLSTYPGQEVVTGEVDSIMVYGKPLPPQNLGIAFNRGEFTSIDNKLYAIGYPLTYTEVDTFAEAGGPVGDVFYHYRYRVEAGEWVGYSEVVDEAMISLQVDDLGDAAVVKSGYGKNYQVEIVTSNAGGFVSEVETIGFTYKSFPEPFVQRAYLVVEEGDRSLTVTWPEVSEVNGSTIANYTVALSVNLYEEPVQSVTAVEKKVVFVGLTNNQSYHITVIPNGTVTGNILTALSVVTGYNIGDPIEQGSLEDEILTAYTGAGDLDTYTPQGAPEAIENLVVTADDDQATVAWDKASTGSPATKYVLEYLADVRTTITNIDVTGDVADAELSRLSWGGAISIDVTTNDSGSYSQVVSSLSVSSATNVFRVRTVRIDDFGKEWLGEYRYYALGTDRSQAPSSVGDLSFSEHAVAGSFKVIWTKPEDAGQDKDKVTARLEGYRVSWGTNSTVLGEEFEITDPDTLEYEITDLTPGTQYYVLVQAKNNNTEGKIYNTGSLGNTYTVRPPGPVSSITYSRHTINGFKVSWDAATDAGYGPEGKLTSARYRLHWRSDQGSTWQLVTRSDDSATEEGLTGLVSGIRYKVRIQSFNSFSDSGNIIPLNGNAVEGGEVWTISLPGEVGDLAVSDPNYDGENHQGGFKVSWKIPSDRGRTSTGDFAVITGYDVTYAEVNGGSTESMSLEATSTEYLFTDLKPNTKYDIRIRARIADGAGAESHISGWVPSLPGVVDRGSILFSSPTANKIRIEWTAPQPGRAGGSSASNAFTRYRVEVVPEGGGEKYLEDDYSGNVITATGLSKSTEYRAQITAKNIWGEAATSVSTSRGTTDEKDSTPPSAVANLKVDSFTANRVVLSWVAPTDTGTVDGKTVPLIGYRVHYRKTAEVQFTEIHEKSERVSLTEALTDTSTHATVTGLDGDTEYTFLVVAVNLGNAVGPDTDASRIAQATRAVVPPGNLRKSLTCVKTDSVGLAWDASSGATSYKLYRDDEEISGSITTTYTDTGLAPGKSYTYKVRACEGTTCSGDSASLTITTLRVKSFKSIIDLGMTPTDLTGYDKRSREIFSLYNGGADIVAKYVKAGGSGNGSSFTNAEGDPKAVIDGISDASATKVYMVFLAGGDYTPETMAMKNYVAIVGGVDECLGSSDTATVLDGEGTRRVFNNENLNHTALLYGVRVINGKAEDPDNGGGMYNNLSSPSLVRVIFFGNTTKSDGGGMYNFRSSPRLTWVTFSRNTANRDGGGMYNTFYSSPSLVGVTFSGNTATGNGGGMYNYSSSPTSIGVTFYRNTADNSGGGMFNDNGGEEGPLIINGVFWGNTTTKSGPEFFIENNGSSEENLRIYNSIVKGGTGNLISGTNYTSVNHGGFVSGGGSAPVVISFTNIITTDPKLDILADNDDGVWTHAIPINSPAVNQGLYVRKAGSTYYYGMEDDTGVIVWYSNPDLSKTVATLPADAEDITATDATGYARKGSPDLGAHEAR